MDQLADLSETASATTRVLYLTHRPVRDATHWSGIPHWTARKLSQAGAAVKNLSFDLRPLKLLLAPIRVWNRLFSREWMAERSPLLLLMLRLWIGMRLFAIRADVILCESSILAAACPGRLPVAFWTDAEFQSYAAAYWDRTRVARLANVESAARQEQAALRRSDAALYASRWAIEEVRRRYQAPAERLHFVPFFANIEPEPTSEECEGIIKARPRDEISLLFIGVDWRRKGGDRALALTQALRRRGLPARLHVIGASPFGTGAVPEEVTQHGFWSKQDSSRWRNAFSKSSFLMLPSRAEAMGISVLEGAAFALPAIATPVGGIPSVVEDGVNGLLDSFEDIDSLAERVAALLRDRACYDALCRDTAALFRERFSTAVRSRQVLALLEKLAREGRMGTAR